MLKFLGVFLAVFFLVKSADAQNTNTELGSQNFNQRYYSSGYYDFSDPGSINIKIAVWGFVRYPGKYLVPEYTSITDLLSFAGGPNEEANLDDVRLYRVFEDGKEQMIKINYDDLMWEDHLSQNSKRNVPKIQPSDILIVPGEPRLYFRDYFSMGLSILGIVLTVTDLIISLNK
ncbi:MAG TPA: SLBB domain-containing protein [Ignavibacteriaceae bacterium]|nr:SLBB domain-containing protein [Ignavibacteriaceae bacterium]